MLHKEVKSPIYNVGNRKQSCVSVSAAVHTEYRFRLAIIEAEIKFHKWLADQPRLHLVLFPDELTAANLCRYEKVANFTIKGLSAPHRICDKSGVLQGGRGLSAGLLGFHFMACW